MANTIKQKRGTGANPTASDLEIGELAIRTDNGHLFTKNDSGTVIEHADISNNNQLTNGAGYLTSVGTSDIDDDAVTVAKIQNFGQNQIAGRISSGTGNLEGLSAANVRTIINVEDGATADQTAAEILTLLSDQNIATTGNLQGDDLTTTGVQLASSSALGRYVRMYGSSGTGQWDIYGNGANLRFTDNQSAGKVVIDTELQSANFEIISANPSISFAENDQDPDFKILCNSGQFRLQNATAPANLFTATATALTSVINHDFSAGIDVTGDITATGDLTITSATPIINLTDSNNDSDYQIKNGNGDFNIKDVTNEANRLSINSSGTVDVAGNLDVGAGLDVTGNITVTGTVDGRDLATDGTKLDGIATGATNVSNTNQLTNGAGFLTSVSTSDIDDNNVTLAKIENIATSRILGRVTSGTGDPETLTAAQVRTLLNVEDGATADQTQSDIDALNVNAATFTVADESSDTSCNVLFATGGSGNVAAKSGSNLTFNSSSGLLVASGFSGDGSALTGLNGSQVTSGTIPAARLPSTITGDKTFSGAVEIGTAKLGNQLIEKANIIAAKLSADADVDVDNGNVFFYGIGETANATPNITSTASNINSIMATGDIMTVTVIAISSGAGFYQDVTIDGSQPSFQRWLDDDEPSSASANGDFEVYTYTLIKTASNVFSILANRSVFK